MCLNKYDVPMMESAVAFSKMSTAVRNQVGCIISKQDRIIAMGYNGTLSGLDNNCEVECPECKGESSIHYDPQYGEGCKKCQNTGLVTSEFVIHAEQNAISFCAKNGIPLDGTTLYLTLSPCTTCAKMIAACGINRVVYKELYRDEGGIQYLEKCNIKTEKLK